ncbi:MAG: serine hydrolase domain-containing protein [Acidobacteriaceae bacterium]
MLIAKNNDIVFEHAYGLADRNSKRPNDMDTRFMLGSMNKMFTSVAIAQLVQAGKLHYTDTLAQILPDYPDKEIAQKVTLHHLLTHTSGLGDFFGPEYDKRKANLHSLSDYVQLFAGKALKFEPGRGWAYSNAGMIVAGIIVEKVSGENYYDYVEQHIFKPAGMNASGWFKRDEIKSGAAADHAFGYTKQDGATEWTYNYDSLGYRGTSAGGGSSNVHDLLKFSQALQSGKLLSPELVQTITAGKVDTGMMGDKHGYGFMVNAESGHPTIGHGGGAPGMNADFKMIPDTGYCIIVLSNFDPPAAQRVSGWILQRLTL